MLAVGQALSFVGGFMYISTDGAQQGLHHATCTLNASGLQLLLCSHALAWLLLSVPCKPTGTACL